MSSLHIGLGATALGLLLAASCRREPAPPPARRAPARSFVARSDRRLELREVEDPALRRRLADTSAALVYAHRLRFEGERAVRAAPTLGHAKQLCPAERFAQEPSWSFCSGTLVDQDLVLTAGHCLGPDAAQAAERCQRIRVVFGYQLGADGSVHDPAAGDVYACRRVAAYRRDPRDPNGTDFAVIQLDRSVSRDRAPAPVTERLPMPGDRLATAGYGAGLPLKVERAATVLARLGPEQIATDADTFAGGSGGGLYDPAGDLVALHVSGGVDWQFEGNCTRAETDGRKEREQRASPAIAGLCRAGWPSASLCRTRPVCGDGICSAGEHRACPLDCRPPVCGDGLCEAAERAGCPADCAPYRDVPVSWGDDPETYRRMRQTP